MFGFGKTKPFTREEFDAAVETVRERMTQGDYVGGAQAAAALRRSVETRNGAHGLMWGEAHLLEARVAMTLGDFGTGLEHVRAATDLRGDDDEVVRARLTAQLSLGDMLAEMGEFDEAERALRGALERRRDVKGLESLSKLLFTQGRFDEAAKLAKEAAQSPRDDDAERGGREAAVMLWLTAEKALRPADPALDLLEPHDLETMLPGLADAPASRVIDALIDLRWEIYARLDDLDAKKRCLIAIAQGARALARHDDRIRALQDYVEFVDPGGGEEAEHARQALALAHEEAGDD